MGPHPHDRSQRRQKQLSELDATEQKLALGWRETWRAEATEPERLARAADHRADGEEKKRRARYAAGIARSEFGRHYWDARREAGATKRPRDG
jgi:hypothetical protein